MPADAGQGAKAALAKQVRDAAAQIRGHHAVAVLGSGLSASRYPMTAQTPPLVWAALDAHPATRRGVASRLQRADDKAKNLVGTDPDALDIAWSEIASSLPARRTFQQAFTDLDLEREPSPAHFALAQMLRAGLVEYVISFNWDTALERAYEHLYGVKIPIDMLVKPHGDANRPDLTWVLPHEEGVVPPQMTSRLEAMAESHPRVFMIVGYSGSDSAVVSQLIEPFTGSWPVARIGPSSAGQESIQATADDALPALLHDLNLGVSTRRWRSVTFDRQRSLSAALMGYRLGPNDVRACPELPGIAGIVSRVKAAQFVAIAGVSGSGKSITAFHAAHRLNQHGWSVIELVNPGSADCNSVEEFISHAGPVVAVVDDAQSIPFDTIREFERATSRDHAVILCVTSWESPAEQVQLVAKHAVESMASFCFDHADEVGELVTQVDDRVGYGMASERIQRRIEVASAAEFPWQFMHTLSGGERRLGEALGALRDDNFDILLGLVALQQVISTDEGSSTEELQNHAKTVGFDAEWLTSALSELERRRLVFKRDGRVRTPHIRFAVRLLVDIFKTPTADPAPKILEIARQALRSQSVGERGKFWLLDAIQPEALRHSRLLVDDATRDYLTSEWLESMERGPGLQPYLLWTVDRWWNDLPQHTWDQITKLLPEWISTANNDSVYGTWWLLNALRGRNKEAHYQVSTKVGVARFINRMISAATGSYVGNWEGLIGELSQVDYDTWRGWASSIASDVDLREFDAWVARELPQSRYLRGWADLAHSLWACSAHMVETIVREMTPRIIEGFETEPIETSGQLIEWYMSFLPLLVENDREFPAEHEEDIATYRRAMIGWIDQVDWAKAGDSLSNVHPEEFQNFSMLTHYLKLIDPLKLDLMCHSIDIDLLDARCKGCWGDQIWRLGDAMLAFGMSSDSEPARTLLLRHAHELTELPPWAIRVVPELAVQLAPVGGIYLKDRRFSFDWGECAEAIESLAAVDRPATLEIIEKNRSVLLQELRSASQYSGEHLPRFISILDSLDPDLFNGLLAQLDVRSFAGAWVKQLEKGAEESAVVSTLLARMNISDVELRQIAND